MTTLASGYDPKSFESRLYQQWEASGAFAPQGDGPAYTILLPPPNVTGTLHMGHAFQHTLMDALVRYHRMRGYRTLWQMGTDHAGIATEMVVSRNLAIEGKGETRDTLGRDAFIEKVWAWKQHSGDTIERQMRRLGASGDWSRSVFTMDPMASEAVVEAFVRLHEQGLIYRGQRLVNWDPVLKTAISDLEVASEEENGHMWSIRYPLADGASYEHVETDADGNEILRETRDYLVVATTRPETMLGDTAAMVHPEDPRYLAIHGKFVELPLTGRRIPVITDDYVDRDFGTGVVKVTPAHDFNDYAVWQRHVESGIFDNLTKRGLINILTPTAKIIGDTETEATPKDRAGAARTIDTKTVFEIPSRYRGLDRFEARKSIVADLEAAGLLVEIKPHRLQVPRGDRSGQVIEPFLTDQWFVKMDTLAQRGLELVESGEVKFVPPNWINTYRHWLENIQEWTISRQLWWGHRIPAWRLKFDLINEDFFVGRDYKEAYGKMLDELYEGPGLGHEIDIDAVRSVIENSIDEISLREMLFANEDWNELILDRDPDVLETWFSSAMFPFSTQGWPNEDKMGELGFDIALPTSVLVTGFDIIFFWVARMIMMSDRLIGRVPFRDVYITGLVRDKDGQKMSKSKGNILDPLDIIDGISADALVAKRTTGLMKPTDAPKIEKATRKEFPEGIPAFGADALRFTMAALAGPGRDIKFDLQRAEGYKNFCNKLWNATRFVLMNLESIPAGERKWLHAERQFSTGGLVINEWIVGRLQETVADVRTHFANYRFDLAAQSVYEFLWNEFCDWFIELSKPYFQGDSAGHKDFTAQTALQVLESALRLLHPITPFVTEELWRQIAPQLGIAGESVMTQPYPAPESHLIDQDANADIEWLKAMVSALRRIRSELGVSPAKQVSLLVRGGNTDDAARIERFGPQLRFLCKLDRIETLAGEPPAAAPAVVGDLQLFVPLQGLVDLDAERVRLDKEIARVAGEKGKSEAKLAKFGGNVPAAVVEQERARLADWSSKLAALTEQRARLA